MSKGNKRRGNREIRKPKKTVEKAPATADFGKSKGMPILGQKKVN